MAVLDGNVQVDVKFTGSGNVTAKAAEAGKAVAGVDKSAKNLNTSLKTTSSRFGEIGSAAASGADKGMAAFGKWSGIIGGFASIVGGVVAGLVSLTQTDFTHVIRSTNLLAAASAKVAEGWQDAVEASNRMPGAIRNAQMTALQARLSEAQAKGDTAGARDLTAEIARFASSTLAGDLRKSGEEWKKAGRAAEATRLAAEENYYTVKKRLAELDLEARQTHPGFHTSAMQEKRAVEVSRLVWLLPQLELAIKATPVEEGWREAWAEHERAAKLVEQSGAAVADAATKPKNQSGAALRKANAAYGLQMAEAGTAQVREMLREQFMADKARQADDERDAKILADPEILAQLDADIGRFESKNSIANQADGWTKFGDAVGYATSQIAAFIPEFAAFGEAASEVSEIWSKYADEQFNVGAAVGSSAGALAKAGAQQIKNERARAGVLALIELGLGLGKQFVPGLQAEAAGHFASAAVLGLVAAGVGGGGGKSGGKRTQPKPRQLTSSESRGSGNWTVNINAPYLASSQETARAIRDIVGGV